MAYKDQTLVLAIAGCFTCLIGGQQALGQAASSSEKHGSADNRHETASNAPGVSVTIARSYDRMFEDLLNDYWDMGTASLPHILPTDGSGGVKTGLVIGNANVFSFWQMSEYADVLYWDWKINHSKETARKISEQWDYVRKTFTDRQLSTGWLGQTINASDDAAWEANYLVQVVDVTGDRRALADAAVLIPSVLAYFADRTPGTSVTYGPGVVGSRYGILYVTPAQTSAYHSFGAISTAYETPLALAALSVYSITGNKAFLGYAEGTWSWQHKYIFTTAANEHGLTKPAPGLVYCELDIRLKESDGKPNPHYLQPMNDNFGVPQQGLSAESVGGTMAMAVLSQRLYAATHNPIYATQADSIVAAMVAPNGFVTAQGLLLNDRDPWTDGYWAPAFAVEVLPRSEPSAASRLATVFRATALNIMAQRTPAGHYGGNWSGLPGGIPARNALGFSTYEAQAASANGGKGGGQASPEQIMTSASSASLVQAALAIEARPKER